MRMNRRKPVHSAFLSTGIDENHNLLLISSITHRYSTLLDE